MRGMTRLNYATQGVKRARGRPRVDMAGPAWIPAEAFRAWQDRLTWNNAETARRLACSPNTIHAYREKGCDGGIGLAMLALDAGWREWSPVAEREARKLSRIKAAMAD